ncbi:hypothetical protein [Streptomyces liangshanensis]|uniref:hypothetical protein n=1 Tax=Streptomyces liangshanensis TaxID=2717324 RepID=UPI0036DF53C0
MTTPPPLSGPPAPPAQDPRIRDVFPDHADAHAAVADLVPPADAGLVTAGLAAELDRGRLLRDQLGRLSEELLHAPFPDGFRGVDIAGVELVLVDADVAGLVRRELGGGLDDNGLADLWSRVADLDKVVPLINSAYCAAYFARLRTLAALAAARHTPTAT